jgi:hypothetical protein
MGTLGLWHGMCMCTRHIKRAKEQKMGTLREVIEANIGTDTATPEYLAGLGYGEEALNAEAELTYQDDDISIWEVYGGYHCSSSGEECWSDNPVADGLVTLADWDLYGVDLAGTGALYMDEIPVFYREHGANWVILHPEDKEIMASDVSDITDLDITFRQTYKQLCQLMGAVAKKKPYSATVISWAEAWSPGVSYSLRYIGWIE